MLLKKDLLQHLPALFPLTTKLQPEGVLSAPVSCVMFDIYGTLFISASGDVGISRKNTLNLGKLDALLEKYGVDSTSKELIDLFYGCILREHDRLRQKGVAVPEVDVRSIWAEVLANRTDEEIENFAIEFELIANPVYPMPHLENLLGACRERNLAIGVISNAQFFTPLLFRWFLDAEPADLGFQSQLMIYSYQHGIAKPSTELFHIATRRIERLGLCLGNVLYLGNDMLNDILPARSVGFKTALFAGDARSLRLREDEPACRELKPDLIITGLDQLIRYL